MVSFTYRGLMPPVFTPMNEDFTINYKIIPDYMKYLVNNNFKAILVNGTTGEGPSLTLSERKTVVEAWINAAKPYGVHVMVQIGGTNMFDAMELARHAESVKANSLLSLPELYFKPQTVEELVSYFEQLAKAAPNTPILYYHIPGFSKVTINMPKFISAARERVPTFKGIKFTSNDMDEGGAALTAGRRDHAVFLGADTLTAPAFSYGFDSSIGTTFNMQPKISQDIAQAVTDKNFEKALELQRKLNGIISVLADEGTWVPIMKAAMNMMTKINVGPPRPPLKALSQEQINRITKTLKERSLWETK